MLVRILFEKRKHVRTNASNGTLCMYAFISCIHMKIQDLCCIPLNARIRAAHAHAHLLKHFLCGIVAKFYVFL